MDIRPGFICLEISGKNCWKYFKNEIGGHRWQRIPPTEKRGRIQTSTITVSVLPIDEIKIFQINESDLSWQAVRGSGNGGQARNKTSNCVIMKHKPSGIQVRVESDRSQLMNKESAIRLIVAKLQNLIDIEKTANRSQTRKNQIGSGERGDKRRTIRIKDNIVADHVTGKTMSAKKYLKGNLKELY